MHIPSTQKLVKAYLDETGDLGADLSRSGTSPIFGFASLVVPPNAELPLRQAVEVLRQDFDVPNGKVMSWKEHLRTNEKRTHALNTFAQIEDITALYIYADKRVVTGPYVKKRGHLYNYVASKIYKSTLWAARNQNATSVEINFSHVKSFDHTTTSDYFRNYIDADDKVPNDLLSTGSPRWVSADKFLESQAADIYAGALKAAVWPDAYGNIDEKYLKIVWNQVRTGLDGCKIPLGFMSMPEHSVARNLKWWTCDCGKC